MRPKPFYLLVIFAHFTVQFTSMSNPETIREHSTYKLSFDYLPKPVTSTFSPEDALQLELLIKVSENMREKPEMTYNEAISAGVNELYKKIPKTKMFTKVSGPVEQYVIEIPTVVDYVQELRDIQAIKMNGLLKKNRDEIPPFSAFTKNKGKRRF